jgi:hypothetical protein
MPDVYPGRPAGGPFGRSVALVATSRSIALPLVQPSFPECTGIVQIKPSLPDRAESSSPADSAESATNQKPLGSRVMPVLTPR